jgi:hypothetical protein
VIDAQYQEVGTKSKTQLLFIGLKALATEGTEGTEYAEGSKA